MTPARRGDLAVVVTTERTSVIGQPTVIAERVEVGVVTSVTREGVVRLVRRAWQEDAATGLDVKRADRVLVASREAIDVTEAIRLAREHSWPGHPESPMPFPSVEAARTTISRAGRPDHDQPRRQGA